MKLLLAFLFCVISLEAQVDQLSINAPYVTTPDRAVDAMLKLTGVKTGDVVYDLGCGDGRIVISAAKKYGVRGFGIDINPERIQEARANASKAQVTALVKFEAGDLFETDLHDATVVALYLLPDLNLRLRPKLLRELKPGARVVSNTFGMGDWKPDKELIVEGSRIYLWTIKQSQSRCCSGSASEHRGNLPTASTPK